ncbi:unnamed protein product, partial [Mycena citricolor]
TRPSSPPDAGPIRSEEIAVDSVEAEAMQSVEDVAGVLKGQEGTLDQGHIEQSLTSISSAFGGADASAHQVHSADASAVQTSGPVHPPSATNDAPTLPPPSESALSFHQLDSLVEDNDTDQALPVLEQTAESSAPSLDDIMGPSRVPMLGPSGKVVLKSHIDRILESIRVAGEETGLSPSQILYNVSNSFKLPEFRTINNWNTFGRMYKQNPWYYFRKAFPDDPCTEEPPNDSATIRACYDTFKENEKWEEALETFRVMEAQMLEQTKAERRKIFQKAERVVNDVFETCHRLYRIEGQAYLCGSLINEDGSLGTSISSGGFKQHPVSTLYSFLTVHEHIAQITERLRTLTMDELRHLDEDGMLAAARSSAYALPETSGTQMMSSSGGPPAALASLPADASANPFTDGAANPADASAVATSSSAAHQLTLLAPGVAAVPALPTIMAWDPNSINQSRSASISGHRHLVISNIRTCATIDIGSEPLGRQYSNLPWVEAGSRFYNFHCLLSGHPAAVRLPAEVKLRRKGAKGSGDWDYGSLGEFDLAFQARGQTPSGQWNGNGLGFRRRDIVPGSFVIFTHDYRFGPSDPSDPEVVRRHFASSGGEFLPAETTNGEVWLVNYDFDLPNPVIAKKKLVEDSMKVFRGQVDQSPKKSKKEGKGKKSAKEKESAKGKGKQKAVAFSHRSMSESGSESDSDGRDQSGEDDDTEASGTDEEQAVGARVVTRSQSSRKDSVAATASKTTTPKAATTSSTPAEASASPSKTSAAASASTGKTSAGASASKSMAKPAPKPKKATPAPAEASASPSKTSAAASASTEKTSAGASASNSMAKPAPKPKKATPAPATLPNLGAAKQVEDAVDQSSDPQGESANQAVRPKRKAAIDAETRWEKRPRIDQSTPGRKRKAEEPVSAAPPTKKPKPIRPKKSTAKKQFKSAETVLSEVEEADEETEKRDIEDNANNEEKTQGAQSSADDAGPAPPILCRSARERRPPPSKQIGGGPQDAEPGPSDSWPPVTGHESQLTRKQLDFLVSLQKDIKTTLYVVQKTPPGCQHLSNIKLAEKLVGWCFGSLDHSSPQYLLWSDDGAATVESFKEPAQPTASSSKRSPQPEASSS